ncbi:hypothetical protein RM572_00305 [Streptomyces sp. DSM 42041]|uniref:C2H2-type domain-containing protein n=1 Tax=Streptomyces hazeniae TaxID=3075538 RepID=A0ABU2NJQ9_9ACTN|nr:hypothetical protein [Streptomyces sp. DSM 42041]MDT0377217.1 hypothetical protein [Streptomyces sp. DSM 42041]
MATDTGATPPRLIPSGKCFCGCGEDVGLGSFFARGHDKTAEGALLAARYEASVAHLLDHHGFGPDNSVTEAAIAAGRWAECRCGFRGGEQSMRNHQKNHCAYRADGGLTHEGALLRAVKEGPGDWDTARAVQALREAGKPASESRARDKLRKLHEDGHLVRTGPARYRTTD